MIREFLTFYKMEHTLSVFVPEMGLTTDFPKSRSSMATECNLSKKEDDTTKPLILNMVEKVRVGDYGGPGSANKNNNSIENS